MDTGALRGFWVSGGGVRCGSGDGVTCRGGLCGIGPALAGKLGGGSAIALRAGFLWIASNARSGPIPLPPAGGVVWERDEAFSLWIWVRWEVSGFLVGVCAVVLAMGWDAVGGSAGSVLRSQKGKP
jgi:hypothetical protein